MRVHVPGMHPFFAQGPRSVSDGTEQLDKIPLYTCTRSSKLKDVLQILSNNSIHRVGEHLKRV